MDSDYDLVLLTFNGVGGVGFRPYVTHCLLSLGNNPSEFSCSLCKRLRVRVYFVDFDSHLVLSHFGTLLN